MRRNPVNEGVVRWRGVERDGTHPPLVSRELYDEVQAVRDAHSSGGKRSWKHDHYLRGTQVWAEVAERERHGVEATVFLGRRLHPLANERERLLRAYYADAIDVQTSSAGKCGSTPRWRRPSHSSRPTGRS